MGYLPMMTIQLQIKNTKIIFRNPILFLIETIVFYLLNIILLFKRRSETYCHQLRITSYLWSTKSNYSPILFIIGLVHSFSFYYLQHIE